MLLMENIKLAVFAIKANKMRSFLTMLGIIIGISSVISITSIGASAQGVIEKEFDTIGPGYMYLMINWQQLDVVETGDLFTQEDIEALQERFPEDIRYAAPYFSMRSDTKIGRREGELGLMGVGAEYNKFNKGMNLLYGRMINKGDVEASRDNVVIDVEAARFFFNKDNVVGETLPVTINGNSKDLTIVGIYEIPPSIFTALDMSQSYTCYTAYSILTTPDEPFSFIEIYANPEKDVAAQGAAFAAYLERIKDKVPGTFRSETAESQLGMINTVLGTLSLAIGAIAAISLLVGGIGIMNIMLVSVTERTREIGIRKSLGARTKDILTQFLIEATILSVIGGIIGTVLGLSVAGIGMSLFKIAIVIQPGAVIIAVIFSAAVGMFFGLFPARKAAKLDPIEALRYE